MFIKNWGIKREITQKDIEKEDHVLHNAICEQIQIGFDASEGSTSLKRAYHSRIDKAVKQLHTDDRMVYDLLYSYKKSFVAMFQSEGLTPVFAERDYFDRDITQKLNKIAEFDIENMGKDLKDKKILGDIFDYGVGLRVYNGYDKVNKCPIYVTPSPLSWYYDPNGSVLDVDFDFHMFAYQTSLPALKYTNALTGGYFCLDDVATGTYTRNSENLNGRAQRLQSNTDVADDTVYIYNCFITLNGHRYFCVVANDLTKIIKWELQAPRTPEERKDGTLVPFKISISNAMVDAYDPWGISYREKVYPTQIALTEITNAIHSKQLRDAGHEIVFYDIDRIDNPANLLVRPVDGPNFVPVRNLGQGPMSSPAMESNDTSKTQQYIQQLEYYAENTTALTGIVRGLAPDAGTLGEAEIQMQKSNALFSVDATTLVAGERMFWINIYYRSLQENLPFIGEKAVVLGIGGGDIVVLRNAELKGFNTPYITIKSKRKLADENNKKLSSMQAMRPLLQQDPNVSPVSKRMFVRELMLLQGQDQDFIHTIYALDSSERHAKRMQDNVNLGRKPENLVVPGLDLQTLWIYLNACVDNDQKEEVLNQLNMLMIQEGIDKASQPTQEMGGVANSMAAQSLSADIAQKQQALPPNM